MRKNINVLVTRYRWEGMSEADIERINPDEWSKWNNRPVDLTLAGLLFCRLNQLKNGIFNRNKITGEVNYSDYSGL